MKQEPDVKKIRKLQIRITQSLMDKLVAEARYYGLSLNHYINFALNSLLIKEVVQFTETIQEYEKKRIEVRVFFSNSEAELLRRYATLNRWSVTKEVRYRIIGTISKNPKLNNQELSVIKGVRSSINILGANINRLIKDRQILGDHNIILCQELISLIKQAKDKIEWLSKCSTSYFHVTN